MELNPHELRRDIFAAYYDARENKRGTSSQLSFELHLEDNMVDLYESLLDRSYIPSRCICFMTHDPVLREVFRFALPGQGGAPSPVQLPESDAGADVRARQLFVPAREGYV